MDLLQYTLADVKLIATIRDDILMHQGFFAEGAEWIADRSDPARVHKSLVEAWNATSGAPDSNSTPPAPESVRPVDCLRHLIALLLANDFDGARFASASEASARPLHGITLREAKAISILAVLLASPDAHQFSSMFDLSRWRSAPSVGVMCAADIAFLCLAGGAGNTGVLRHWMKVVETAYATLGNKRTPDRGRRRKKPGPNPMERAEADQKLAQEYREWSALNVNSVAVFAQQRGIDARQVRLALDRVRKRAGRR